ncbi:MAG: ABC transporter ATP-binding protein [Desulfovibrionaceae bacterium]
MLEGRGLGFRYGRRHGWLFRGLGLRLAPGERVGLPGPSGRGKSTLAKVLAGYLVPQEGDVTIDGQPWKAGDFNPVQILFQHPELAVNPRWKVGDILAEAGPPPSELLRRLQVDGSWMRRYPHELSGGELQRVCLARSLDERTRYLLCDEMTSMLDALTQASIWKTVLEIADARNIGMLVISHDTALLERVCERTMPYFESA